MKTQRVLGKALFCVPVVLMITWNGGPLWAQSPGPENPVCLEEAAKKLRPEDKITLVLRDREKVKGRLVSIDAERFSLRMSNLDQEKPSLSDYQIPDVKSIEYNGGGKAKRMFFGLLIGASIGALIGAVDQSSTSSSDSYIEVPASAALGTFGGLMGLVIGSAMSSTRVIECK